MIEKTISVIIPVYEVEKYLERCIESTLCQTYSTMEIVLVDDGSSDAGAQLCDVYAEKDVRITVIHKPNGGLSDARNAGISYMTGTYVSFIDSDDKITSDYFEVMTRSLQSESSDIVECDIVKFNDDNDLAENYQDDLSVKSFETIDGLSKLIDENLFHQHVWNKLYKSELVLDLYYPVGKLNEDEFWTYQVFGRAKRVTKINKTMYCYFQRESSIMGTAFNLRRLDALEGKYYRQKYIAKSYPALESQAKIDFFSSCIFSGQASLKYLKKAEKKQAISIINKYLKTCKLSKAELNSIDGKKKLWYKFADKSFWLCCKMRSITGIGF